MKYDENYIANVLEQVKARNPGEPEFIQAVKEVLESIAPVLAVRPDYIEAGIVERLVEPDRFISFRVAWVDDN